MSLLTAENVKNSYIFAKIYLIFFKKGTNRLENLLIPNFDGSEKIGKAVTK